MRSRCAAIVASSAAGSPRPRTSASSPAIIARNSARSRRPRRTSWPPYVLWMCLAYPFQTFRLCCRPQNLTGRKKRYLRNELFQRLMPSSRPASAQHRGGRTHSATSVRSTDSMRLTSAHEVKRSVCVAVIQAGRGAKVLAEAHSADDVQRDPQRGVVHVDGGASARCQDAHQLLVHRHHMPKPLPACAPSHAISAQPCCQVKPVSTGQRTGCF